MNIKTIMLAAIVGLMMPVIANAGTTEDRIIYLNKQITIQQAKVDNYNQILIPYVHAEQQYSKISYDNFSIQSELKGTPPVEKNISMTFQLHNNSPYNLTRYTIDTTLQSDSGNVTKPKSSGSDLVTGGTVTLTESLVMTTVKFDPKGTIRETQVVSALEFDIDGKKYRLLNGASPDAESPRVSRDNALATIKKYEDELKTLQ